MDARYKGTMHLLTPPALPSFNRPLSFGLLEWNPFAGERGAFVATSPDGCFEAMAEPMVNGWRFWLVDVNDPENALCAEDLCEC